MKNSTVKIKEKKFLVQCIKEFHSFMREKINLWFLEVITILLSCEQINVLCSDWKNQIWVSKKNTVVNKILVWAFMTLTILTEED